MWVEILPNGLYRNRTYCHPLREDVSWNKKQIRKALASAVILFVRMWVEIFHVIHKSFCKLRHPLREDVSWNVLFHCVLHKLRVILFVRMWVEIADNGRSILAPGVILFVRMWVEIALLIFLSSPCRSSSSWGCELKLQHSYHSTNS